jgi:hypothetical protein
VEAVTFKQADDYRTDVNHVMRKYDHKLNDTELLEIMVGKTGNTTFIKEINNELKKVNPSFDSCCIEIAALQRITIRSRLAQSSNRSRRRCHCQIKALAVVATGALNQSAVIAVILTSAVTARS